MNSIIITFICNICVGFWNIFKRSGIYNLFDKFYNAVSKSFAGSFIVNKISTSDESRKVLESSILYRITDKIFSLLEFIREKAGKAFSDMLENSVIISSCRGFLNGAYALNIRLFGVFLLAVSVVYLGVKFIVFSSFKPVFIIFAVFGGLCILSDKNAADFLNHSAVLKFLTNILGLNIDFEFYKEKYIKGKGTIVMTALIGAVSGGVMAVSFKYGIIIAPALLAVFAVLASPVVGVYMAVFAAPFVPTMALAGLCILTMMSLFFRSLYTKTFKWKFEGVGFGLLMLLGVFFISSLTSFAMVNSLTVWAMYAVFMGFYLVIINTVKTAKQLDGLFRIFVISGALVAVYGIMQYLFGWNTSNAWIDENMFEDATMRVYSTLGNPNVLGEYLLLVLPVSAVYMCVHKKETFAKWVYLIMTVCLFACLILTQSRGCWLGFMLSAMIFVTFYKGRLWGLLPVVLIILPFVVPETIVNRLLSIGNMGDSSTSYRVFIWLGTLAMLKDFWIGGIGMGEAAYNSVYPFYSYNAIIAPHSHNLYLQLLTESGIAALIIFVVVMLVYIKSMMKVYSADKKESKNSLTALAILSGLFGFLLQSMTDYTFYNYRVMAMFFMYLALGMSLKYFTVGGKFHDKNS